ncbi:MAG: hypothetical protein JSS64_07710 [Bacteroidetes bacterium]|nr:hypothetical protein [Bacteroidota bacterium]
MTQNAIYSDIRQLYLEADAIEGKIDELLADRKDFLQLSALAKLFDSCGQVRGSLFCLKLQVKFLFQQYWKYNSLPEGVTILEEAHDLAIELVNRSENKRSVAPSFYKALLKVKIELANAKRSTGFYAEAFDLEQCANRISNKAHKLFPTYQDFPTKLLTK